MPTICYVDIPLYQCIIILLSTPLSPCINVDLVLTIRFRSYHDATTSPFFCAAYPLGPRMVSDSIPYPPHTAADKLLDT